ncbi:MAG: RIP metalloprotease RseP [Desulfuromonadaceae bacterium]|nr:RIP metalloprotease RseP [Desulfuromonadaceae bacterium]
MLTVFSGIILLGILVFIHELGHFGVAKATGVRVLKFSLGFGPKLFSKQWGETEYLLCAIPLGGYVQMLGEGIGEQGEVVELTPEERQHSFADKTIAQRTAIIAAGPIMNLLLPFIVLPIAYMVGVNLPAYVENAPRAGYVVDASPAAAAGLQRNDLIVAVNGDAVSSWDGTNKTLLSHVGAPLEFTILRSGDTLLITLEPENGGIEGLQSIGIMPDVAPLVGGLAPGMPALAAGFEVGDQIVAIESTPINSWYDLRDVIQNYGKRPQQFHLIRDGRELSVEVLPIQRDGKDDLLIGIAPHQETLFKRFGFIDAVRAGADRTVELIELTLTFMQKMFAGQISSKNIGGPITVIQIAGQAAQTDLSSICTVLAFLSIQLGILNLLPIPILDGGHLFFNFFEMLMRRPVPLRTREIAQQVGLIMLLMLMVLAFYNDIVRIFVGGA